MKNNAFTPSSSTLNEELVEYVKKLMLSKGVILTKLADILGMSYVTLGSYLRYYRSMPYPLFIRICRYFGKPVEPWIAKMMAVAVDDIRSNEGLDSNVSIIIDNTVYDV